MNLDLKELAKLQSQFDQEHAGAIEFYEEINESNMESLEHLIVCLVGELGEFSNLVKKVRRGDYSLSEVKDQMGEELADVFIYLLKISSQFHVDLESVYLAKLEKNKKRFSKFRK